MVRDALLDLATTLHGILADPACVTAWDQPSALERMTVGDLAAHTARAVLTPLRYLEAQPPTAAATTTNAAGYLLGLLPEGDVDLDDPLQRGVRERSHQEAEAGRDGVLVALDEALARLQVELPRVPGDRLVEVFGGIVLPLDEYLATRVLELVVHLDDLAVSLDLEVDVEPAAATIAARVLVEVAVHRRGWQPVVRHLARRERAGGTIAAL